MTTDTLTRPLPQHEATPAQHRAIINLVCYKIGEPWTRPPMERVAQFLNSTFNLNLDAELEPLSKREASEIITKLTA